MPGCKETMNNKSKIKPSTPMIHVAFESKLCSVVRSIIYQCPGNCMAIRCAVVYHARAACALSAGIKCWHCICSLSLTIWPHSVITSLSMFLKWYTADICVQPAVPHSVYCNIYITNNFSCDPPHISLFYTWNDFSYDPE